jgi:hypothetical protein
MSKQLIDEVRVCWESGLLILAFYQFWPLLSTKLYKIVDYILCFPCNSRKYELRIGLGSCEIEGVTKTEVLQIVRAGFFYF